MRVGVEVFGVAAVAEERGYVVVASVGLVVQKLGVCVLVKDEQKDLDVAEEAELHRLF